LKPSRENVAAPGGDRTFPSSMRGGVKHSTLSPREGGGKFHYHRKGPQLSSMQMSRRNTIYKRSRGHPAAEKGLTRRFEKWHTLISQGGYSPWEEKRRPEVHGEFSIVGGIEVQRRRKYAIYLDGGEVSREHFAVIKKGITLVGRWSTKGYVLSA